MTFDRMDGIRLRQGVIAGARRVILMQDQLNKINVFPVPDNDTGTNMALTMQSVAEGAIGCHNESIAVMSQCVADAALMGARGNSGAILAQFFQGLAEQLKGEVSATLELFADAVHNARQSAFQAISEPKEGTILTVMHDWAERISAHCHKAHDFLELMREGLHEAQRSLAETPKKMTLLARAGVVDAGAQGFVHMLEGIHNYMQNGKIEHGVGIGGEKATKRAKIEMATEEITYQFCTECLVEGSHIDRLGLRDRLSPMGNSLIVAGSESKVRLHIHTNEPEAIFGIASEYGNVTRRKHDDMRKQHEDSLMTSSAGIAIVTDSSCDLPVEFILRHNIQMVPVQVSLGPQNYLDRITITPDEFYKLLHETGLSPQTSQPKPGDFITAYNEVTHLYDRVLALHLSGDMSGTLQSAGRMAETVSKGKITVVDSRNTSVALGLIVAEAARKIEEGASFKALMEHIEWAVSNTHFYVVFDTVKYLILGGRLSKARGLLAQGLHLKPMMSIENGQPKIIGKSLGMQKALESLLEEVEEAARGKRKLRFGVAHANAPKRAGWLMERLRRNFETDNIMVANVSPALGAHAGPGAVGIAFLGE